MGGGGYALKLPAIDLSGVGADGGSIAWLDKAGSFKVGPQSAGAVPDPACYDAGNDEPPVTDANVVLGYLDPESLAGGSVPIRSERARDAIAGRLTGPLGRDVVEVAFGHPHSGQREHDEGGQGGQGGRRGSPKPVSGTWHDPPAVPETRRRSRTDGRAGRSAVPRKKDHGAAGSRTCRR